MQVHHKKKQKWASKDDEEVIQIDFYLEQADDDDTTAVDLCPFYVYALPHAFFAEPITLCASSMLDFFAL